MERQFTATVYIVDKQSVLLIFHRKFKKWLPPGGHLESNETPPEAARREALEETGLEIEFIPQENVWIKRWNANSFVRPYLCMLEEIPAYGTQPAHQHVDFLYIARPVSMSRLDGEENSRWFSLEEVEALIPDEEIFAETQQVIRHILEEMKRQDKQETIRMGKK